MIARISEDGGMDDVLSESIPRAESADHPRAVPAPSSSPSPALSPGSAPDLRSIFRRESPYVWNTLRFLGVQDRDVDLEDPSASRLSPAAMAAVYQALLTGYLRSEQFADCVELGGLALAALPRPPPAAPLSQALLTSLSELRAQCQRRLPVNALLGP